MGLACEGVVDLDLSETLCNAIAMILIEDHSFSACHILFLIRSLTALAFKLFNRRCGIQRCHEMEVYGANEWSQST